MWKSALISASAVEERMLRMMTDRTRMAPLIGGRGGGLRRQIIGVADAEERKSYPPSLDREVNHKYDTSL